jgi:hypothetical protein
MGNARNGLCLAMGAFLAITVLRRRGAGHREEQGQDMRELQSLLHTEEHRGNRLILKEIFWGN